MFAEISIPGFFTEDAYLSIIMDNHKWKLGMDHSGLPETDWC